MFNLQKLWHNLLCLLGRHDWSDWHTCENMHDKWRGCPWCHTEECGRTFLGRLFDKGMYMLWGYLIDNPDDPVVEEYLERQRLQEFMASVDEIAIAAIRTPPPQEE